MSDETTTDYSYDSNLIEEGPYKGLEKEKMNNIENAVDKNQNLLKNMRNLNINSECNSALIIPRDVIIDNIINNENRYKIYYKTLLIDKYLERVVKIDERKDIDQCEINNFKKELKNSNQTYYIELPKKIIEDIYNEKYDITEEPNYYTSNFLKLGLANKQLVDLLNSKNILSYFRCDNKKDYFDCMTDTDVMINLWTVRGDDANRIEEGGKRRKTKRRLERKSTKKRTRKNKKTKKSSRKYKRASKK
jgi:hypothetical protein